MDDALSQCVTFRRRASSPADSEAVRADASIERECELEIARQRVRDLRLASPSKSGLHCAGESESAIEAGAEAARLHVGGRSADANELRPESFLDPNLTGPDRRYRRP